MKTHRYKLLADALGISINQLEKEVGVGVSTFNKAVQRDASISRGIALRIAERYKNVNIDWLVDGTGEMFTEKTNKVHLVATKGFQKPGSLARFLNMQEWLKIEHTQTEIDNMAKLLKKLDEEHEKEDE